MEKWSENKLFQPRDIEGEPVKEQFDYIRELFKYASQLDPRLKGITIIGSTLKGYALPGKKSDIDIILIADDSPIISSRGQETYDFLANFLGAENELKEIREKAGLPVFKTEEVLRTDINKLTPEKIEDIHSLGTLWAMQGLVFPGVGDLEKYRQIVRNVIKTYPKEKREYWIKYLTNNIAAHFNTRKPFERGMISKDEKEKFLQKKRELVEARVRRIFDPKPN